MLTKYEKGLSVSPEARCELCGAGGDRNDHCHQHGWVRGIVCARCNALIRYTDGAVRTRSSSPSQDDLLDWRYRCPDCAIGEPIEFKDIANVQITAVLPQDLAEKLDRFAKERHWSRSTAVKVLVERGLQEEDKTAP